MICGCRHMQEYDVRQWVTSRSDGDVMFPYKDDDRPCEELSCIIPSFAEWQRFHVCVLFPEKLRWINDVGIILFHTLAAAGACSAIARTISRVEKKTQPCMVICALYWMHMKYRTLSPVVADKYGVTYGQRIIYSHSSHMHPTFVSRMFLTYTKFANSSSF